jgi:hypothetical protein
VNNSLSIKIITSLDLWKTKENKLICKMKKRLLLMIKLIQLNKFRYNLRKKSL